MHIEVNQDGKQNSTSPIILAVDTNDLSVARSWIEALREEVPTFKLGLEFFLAHGISGIKSLQREFDFDLFLDLKLHDIPNTVGKAVASIKELNPKFLTVHASGGSEMISAAASVCDAEKLETKITAVTLLTSLSEDDLQEIGYQGSPIQRAVALANLAINAGAGAIVTSPLEVAEISRSLAGKGVLITPGVRPKGSSADDQNRVMDPKSAISAGADYLVIGRPITAFAKESLTAMVDAAKAINDSLA
jgi:orotidine-5'-phosphate decarboxylase